MRDTLERIWDNIYLRVLSLIAIGYLIYRLLDVTRVAWVSFLIAFLIAYLVEPIVERLERTRVIRRWFSVTLIMLLIVLFFVVSVVLLGEVIVQISTIPLSLVPFFEQLPAQIEDWSQRAPPWLTTFFDENTPSVQAFFEQRQRALTVWAQLQASRLVNNFGRFFGGAAQALAIVVLTAFIISSYTVIKQSFMNLFPPRYRHFAQDLVGKLDRSVGGYVRAKVVEALIVGITVWITLLIMRVPQAAALAFIALILNPIPYLGPALSTIPPVLSAFTVSWQLALAAFIAMTIIQLLDGNVLQPILLARGVAVHPVTVLVSLLVGGALLNFWGLVLSIPIAAFLQLLYTDYYLKSAWYAQETADPPYAPQHYSLEAQRSPNDRAFKRSELDADG
jgi:predicted PurR-regulated permease PerM